MRLYQMADAVRYEMMNTEELRETFLIDELFQPGEIEFAYVDLDRTVIGSAVPTPETLKFDTESDLLAEYFLECWWLGFGHGRRQDLRDGQARCFVRRARIKGRQLCK